MILIGGCAGFFVVPMNALLQHRGHVLMGAGHSIAVQNFNENIGILVMVGLYALMVRTGVAVDAAIVLFGLFVSGTMVLVLLRIRMNQARGDSLHLIGDREKAQAQPVHWATAARSARAGRRPSRRRTPTGPPARREARLPARLPSRGKMLGEERIDLGDAGLRPSANCSGRNAASMLRQTASHAAAPTRGGCRGRRRSHTALSASSR